MGGHPLPPTPHESGGAYSLMAGAVVGALQKRHWRRRKRDADVDALKQKVHHQHHRLQEEHRRRQDRAEPQEPQHQDQHPMQGQQHPQQ